MSVALAAAWHPRGELARFNKLLPKLLDTYTGIAVTLPPDVDRSIEASLERIPGVIVAVTRDWSWGRFSALEKALVFDAGYVQYADFDRLLRWVETRPDEWREALARGRQSDCLIIGRTVAAYRTHPRSLVRTEAISNRFVSHVLDMDVDVSAGSKVFSGTAARFLVENCRPPEEEGAGRALGTDAEWPIVLKKAGFILDYVEIDGLDWESADRFLDQAAGPEGQRRAAEIYDADPQNWARRVEIAMEIVEAGLEAMRRDVIRDPCNKCRE